MLSEICTDRGQRWYALEGSRYPSVTTVIRTIQQLVGEDDYAGVPAALLRAACVDGVTCHSAALSALAEQSGLMDCVGFPDPKPTDDQERWRAITYNAIAGATAWAHSVDAQVLAIEQAGVNRRHGYAGRPDFLAEITYRKQRILAVCELKFTAQALSTHRLQVRAYAKLDEYFQSRMGILIYINKATGQFRQDVVPLAAEPQQWAGFLSAVQVFRAFGAR